MRRIRRWTEEDIPLIAEIERNSFSAPWTEAMLRESFLSPYFNCLVAEKGGLAGYVTYQEIAGEIHIVNLAVSEGFKRQGIAQSLMEALAEIAKGKDMSGLTLEVRESNGPARNLYSKLGFAEAGVRKKFYGDEDGIVMWKYLK